MGFIHSKALTNEKSSMLQFKPRKALAVFNDSYDLRLQMRPYELNNSLILWEGYYDTSKKIFIEEIQEVKIAWKTSHHVTCEDSMQVKMFLGMQETMFLGEQEIYLLRKQEFSI